MTGHKEVCTVCLATHRVVDGLCPRCWRDEAGGVDTPVVATGGATARRDEEEIGR